VSFTFEDLITWSERLPDWQRDALRRILTGGSLNEADISELAALAKADQGLEMPASLRPADPATSSHIRVSSVSNEPVALTALRDIAYVNALAAGPVNFAPEGLTVIYGENASGKSGISRIFKKAGRARNPGGPIRPSVFETDPHQPASATIEFTVGATQRSFHWVDGSATDEELTRINVFDASEAALQVEGNNQLAYVPEILTVFQSLAAACQAVGTKLKAEKDSFEMSRYPEIGLLSLRPRSRAAVLIAGLSSNTRLEDIDNLCDVTEVERERHSSLARALRENPSRQADLLEGRARRLRDLDDLLTQLQNTLNDIALRGFESDLSEATAAGETAKVASLAFATNSVLEGLGTPTWKQLWESARRYSEEFAYATEVFPVTREDASCVLCQQPISRTAGQRLRSFEEFVQNDVQQRANRAAELIRVRKIALESLRIPFSSILLRETGAHDTAEARAIKTFLVATKLRRRYLLRKANGQEANPVGELPPTPNLAAVRVSLSQEIQRLREAARADDRSRMEDEFADLDERLKIAPIKNVLHCEVLRLAIIEALDGARRACDTTWITRKGGEVAQVVVSDRMRSAFASNLTRLGFYAAPVEVKLGPGTVGQHPYYLSLIARQDVRPSEVLSEGEKTCVALAGFLAELETTNNLAGIVLDDPVSSLDHHYRLCVARRLTDVAKARQVVVFTHDIVFLLMLTKYATKAGVRLLEISLRRGGRRHGMPEEGPPWVAMPVNKRIGVLRNELQVAAAALRKGEGDRADYERRIEQIYVRLRASWERAVEEVLLNGVVLRFGDAVATQRLKALTDISEADVQTIDSEMSHCSNFVHDESGAVNSGIPEPPTVEADIKRLDEWVAAVRKRRR
jgi:AAA domain